MSLNNIQLPAFVIRDLYKNSLVEPIAILKKGDSVKNVPFDILGSNLKKICIIVASEETSYVADAELNFLLGILAACKLSIEDVAVLNTCHNKNCTYLTVTKELKAEKIFLFGVDASAIALPLQFPHYQVQGYNNQTYLCAPALSVLQRDKAEKTKLWTCLKGIFAI